MEESCEVKKLNELEILASMYSEDFFLSDPSCLIDLASIITAQQSSPLCNEHKYHRSIRFTLKLTSPSQIHMEVTADLPSNYPSELPSFSIRCGSIQARAQALKLNCDLKKYLSAHVQSGDPAIVEAVQWLVSNVDEYASLPSEEIFEAKKKHEVMARYWIYSHHIYNTTKRKLIVDTARTLHLSGFCMPGKPGLICVEGPQDVCEEFWHTIRSLTWKRINLRHVEVQNSPSLSMPEVTATSSSLPPCNVWKCFLKFEEIFFSSSDNRHGDMAQLKHFLITHNLPHAFHIFFGLDAIQSDKS